MISIRRIYDRLEKLASFNATPNQGITRLSFTPEDKQAREWFMAEAKRMGMDVRIDGAGNTFARLGGKGKAILCGSHLDTVPHGGKYDGALGVVAALEVAETLHESGLALKRPFEVVVWSDEEGGRFGTGLLGSRAAIGFLTEQELSTIRDKSEILLGDALRPFAVGQLESAKLDVENYECYLEVHIEQGSRLMDEGYQVGVVEGIVGISRLVVTIKGQANHAGTTPMNKRRDALFAAAQVVLGVRGIGLKHMPGVATVGQIKALPGAVNVIPGEVTLSIEVRDLSQDTIDTMVQEARKLVAGVCQEAGMQWEDVLLKNSEPSLTDANLKKLMWQEIEALGLKGLSMPSGAGHDAQSLALIMPAAMLFVPSIDGISHSPLEECRPEDIEAGVSVLYKTVERLIT
ncbi:MAG: hydantoinase/carbamoylase family amidase [Bacillota bacterium]|nr:MAG: hydantoinase/carbamoylase family amidase [Bacillota bacterium]